MAKFIVEQCYTVPYYAEVTVEAEDADAACALVQGLDENDRFEPCYDAADSTFISEVVEIQPGDTFTRVAMAPQGAHRPVHPGYRSDEANTAAARDKLYAFVERVANLRLGAETMRDVKGGDGFSLDGVIAGARELIGYIPGATNGQT